MTPIFLTWNEKKKKNTIFKIAINSYVNQVKLLHCRSIPDHRRKRLVWGRAMQWSGSITRRCTIWGTRTRRMLSWGPGTTSSWPYRGRGRHGLVFSTSFSPFLLSIVSFLFRLTLTVVHRGGGTWKPHVSPISSTLPSPSPTSGLSNIAPVTKTSLAAKKQDGPLIGSGHNFSPKPFVRVVR